MASRGLLTLPLLALLACNGGGADDDGSTGTTGDTAGLPEGCDAYVEPGADDQAALQGALLDAAEGATVCLAEGTFTFNTEVTISQKGLTLRGQGMDKTLLDFSLQDDGANGIKITGDDVTVEAFRLVDASGDGIRADEVSNVTFLDLYVEWTADASTENGAYGLYPVGSDGVTIRGCKVKGASDAGLYVGQSTNILVENSEAWGNVAGIEIENSTGATVRNNHAHDNTGGLLIFNLPGLPVKDGKRTLAYGNIIENNNAPNFAEVGTAVSSVPPGVGVMILAADYNELRDNTIRGNKSVGVAIITYTEALFPKHDDVAFDKHSEGNFIHHNTFGNNGTDPDLIVQALTGGLTMIPDIVFDGCDDAMKDNSSGALTNCLSENGAATYLDTASCGGMSSTDIGAVTCTHDPLPDLPAT